MSCIIVNVNEGDTAENPQSDFFMEGGSKITYGSILTVSFTVGQKNGVLTGGNFFKFTNAGLIEILNNDNDTTGVALDTTEIASTPYVVFFPDVEEDIDLVGQIRSTGAMTKGVVGTARFDASGSITNDVLAGIVTAVTYIGTGNYRLELEPDQPDSDYIVSVTGEIGGGGGNGIFFNVPRSAQTDAQFDIFSYTDSTTLADAQNVMVSIIRL